MVWAKVWGSKRRGTRSFMVVYLCLTLKLLAKNAPPSLVPKSHSEEDFDLKLFVLVPMWAFGGK